MNSIGAFEAKTHLSNLLKRVAEGETIQITKHGIPVAMLAPLPPYRKKNLRVLADEIRRSRKGITLGKIRIQNLIIEGRRY